MSTLRSADYVGHMLDAIALACGYVEGIDLAGFEADKRTQQAVLLNIMVIGEASAKLASSAPALLASYPLVPWSSMRGMRNRVMHGYFDVDLQVVWDTVQVALPDLALQLKAVQEALRSGNG
jgi:uncharacterized protein with HEPN domain